MKHQRIARDQVLDPPYRPDHDMAPSAQLGLLGANRRAAEDGDDVDALAAAVGAQSLRDLDAELSRRRQNEPLDLMLGGIDVLKHRQPEGRGLAAPGLRLADNVAPREQRRDRLLLDRARLFVADVPRGGEDCRTGEFLEGPSDRQRWASAMDDSAASGLHGPRLGSRLMSVTVVGSIAFDAVKTPFGERERMLGGSAVHFALAASFFGDVHVVGPVGEDFGVDEHAVLEQRGVVIDDIERVAGGKTFFWRVSTAGTSMIARRSTPS